MTELSLYTGHKLVLFGLGNSGRATAHALSRWGADVTVWDDAETSRAQAREEGLKVFELTHQLFEEASALVLSPGVPLTHPHPHWSVLAANKVGLPIIGDIEIFCKIREHIAPDSPFIAVTGTNGKSTTAALIAHLLAADGRDVVVGGNLGPPILSLQLPAKERIHVIECSSFQIDLTPSLAPTIGVLTNITPDHLDRHGTMDNYARTKEQLITDARVAIIGVDDPYSRAIADRRETSGLPLVRLSSDRILEAGLVFQDSHIFRPDKGAMVEIADLSNCISLRGRHNAQNAAAAMAATMALGVSENALSEGLKTFPGLPHRLEAIGMIGGALAINDSKATNAEATSKALEAYHHQIYWILGGRAKAGGIESLSRYFHQIKKAYLIGEAGAEFARTLKGDVAFEEVGTLERAVEFAARDVVSAGVQGAVILFSPACASFDQFKNFEHRGDEFRRIIRSVDGFKALNREANHASAS